MEYSPRKKRILELAERLAPERMEWRTRTAYFHEEDLRYMQFLVPAGSRVLELGCGNGELLAALKPDYGVGVDFSEQMIKVARERYPEHQFIEADIEDPDWTTSIEGPFDYLIIADTAGSLDDCQCALEYLHTLCNRQTRIIISYYAYFWEPLLKFAERMKWKMQTESQNVLSTSDIKNLLHLADFDVIRRDWRQLLPLRLWGLGPIINRYLGTLPGLRRFCLRNYVVSRSNRSLGSRPQSASVVVPCRNERGNIEAAVTRIPQFCQDIEIIFVEGHSNDGTYEEAKRVARKYEDSRDIKVFRQDGVGKADAVYKGFDHARGDVLIILDADLTVPPEQLDKFWSVMINGNGEYAHGTRLVYPMEQEAMRFLNLIANWVFSVVFTWLLNQRFTDTLCGTKALRKDDYERLKQNRSYFGNFDPFGDFDLIFGAAKLNLKTVEVPIRYVAREYGETQISRFRHGWILMKMVVFSYRKLKAF